MISELILLLSVMTLAISKVDAIDCNFSFIESEKTSSVSKAAQTEIVISAGDSSGRLFECDQHLDDDLDFTFVNESTQPEVIGNRFNSQDKFEVQESSCVSSKRFITPRALNNIYNQLTTVVNSATYVQKIQITECRTHRESCNDHFYNSPSFFRYICWQEYLIIKLSAIRNGGTIYEEDFYYPSQCSCRLVMVKRARNPVIDV